MHTIDAAPVILEQYEFFNILSLLFEELCMTSSD